VVNRTVLFQIDLLVLYLFFGVHLDLLRNIWIIKLICLNRILVVLLQSRSLPHLCRQISICLVLMVG
jgi:hypothetical protein